MRYLVFRIECYYPAGGWDDLEATTNDKETAIELAKKIEAEFSSGEVIDLDTGTRLYPPWRGDDEDE